MTERRVAIIDASHSLFPAGNPPSSLSSFKAKNGAQPSSKKGTRDQGRDEGTLSLHPIPGFAEIITDAVRDVSSTGSVLGQIAPVDVGIVCDASAVRPLGRAVHERVRARLKML
jgi:mediator of RNA polymerase II transcription subunit 14